MLEEYNENTNMSPEQKIQAKDNAYDETQQIFLLA